ncbi:hypothetical protein BH11MYX3_BH11MYX3_01520 [soil metagenome]
MRFLVAAVVLATAACGSSSLHTLNLAWKDADTTVKPASSVGQALATVPIGFGVRDVRPDPTVVGSDADSGTLVRTHDNVAQYCSNRLGLMLRNAGARLNEQPAAMIEADLLEFRVDEGGTFKGLARIRVTVRHGQTPEWSKTYEGTSTRWGRSHNPENYNEALSNSLSEAVEKLLKDDDLAAALMAPPAAPQGT